MARILLDANPTVVPFIYVVESSVGQGGVNKTDDVLLVQFFLRVLMEDGGGEKGYRPPGQAPLPTTGQCGTQTLAYIRFFQEEGNRRNPGSRTTTDGRVDPMVSGSSFGSLSHTLYTIVALNIAYKSRRGVAMLANISRDPLFPPGLVKPFYVGK